MDEVHRPTLVRALWLRQGNASQGGQLFSTFTAQGQAFLAVDAFGALVIDDEAFSFEDIVQDGSAPTRFESGPLAETFAQGGVVAALRLVLQRGTVPASEAADSANGEPKAGDDFSHGSAARFGL